MNMKMKFLLAPALLLVTGSGLWAQATKVALVNMQDAIAGTKEGQARIAELEKKYGPKQQEFQKRSSDIQAKEEQLKKTQNTISEEARASLEADINRLKTTLQRDMTDAQTDSQEDQQKLLADVGNKVYAAVTKYAQDNQIMLVFDVSSEPNNIICCGSAPEITKEIIALYDKGATTASTPATSTPAKPAGTTAAPPASRPPASTPTRPAGSGAPSK